MYGNDKNISNDEIYQYLKLLETFKEEENYDLNRIINNKSLSGKCKKHLLEHCYLT